MHAWSETATALHDRQRRAASGDRLLVLFRLGELPADPRPGGAAVFEAWRWFQNQPGTGAAIVVERPGGGAAPEAGVAEAPDPDLVALRAIAAAHELRVPAELFAAGPLDVDAWRRAGWRPSVIVDAQRRDDDLDREVPIVAAPALALTSAARTAVVEGGGNGASARAPEVTWSGLDGREDLDAFFGSTVNSVDVPLRRGDHGDVVIDGRDGFVAPLDELLGELAQCCKGVRLRLEVERPLQQRALAIVARSGFPTADLRLAARPEDLGPRGFVELAEAAPGALLECPLDFLGSVLAIDDDVARGLVERLVEDGVGRFLLRRDRAGCGAIASALTRWGHAFDIGGLGRLTAFLEALETAPAGLTTDFGLAARPNLRQTVDAAMGAGPPVARTRSRREPPTTGRARRSLQT